MEEGVWAWRYLSVATPAVGIYMVVLPLWLPGSLSLAALPGG